MAFIHPEPLLLILGLKADSYRSKTVIRVVSAITTDAPPWMKAECQWQGHAGHCAGSKELRRKRSFSRTTRHFKLHISARIGHDWLCLPDALITTTRVGRNRIVELQPINN